ncbi:MFS transporter [Gordonia caeni]
MRARRRPPACLRPGSRPLLIAMFSISSGVGYIAMIQILPVILIPMADDLGVSRTAIAASSTVSTLVGALAAFPVGRLLDRFGGRALMAAGSGIGAVGVLIWSQATSPVVLYAAFAVIGMALVMSTYEAAFAVIVVVDDAAHRDRTILAVTMIAGLATYLVYPLLGWLNTTYGWRTTLVILAVALAVTSVPGHLWAIPSSAVHRSRVRTLPGIRVGEALRQRRLWLIMFAFVAQSASVSAFLLLVITYLRDIGHSEAVATAIPIAIGVLQVLSRLALVTVARRMPMTLAATLAIGIQGIGLLVLPLVGLSIALTLLCVAAVGLGQGVSVIARPSIVADGFGVAEFASVLATISIPLALARAGSPLVGTWLADWRFLVLGGAVALVGSLALLRVHIAHPVHPAEEPVPLPDARATAARV